MVTPHSIAALIVGASVAALAAAFFAQYAAGLAPCPLCVYQRYPYGLTIALGALALAARGGWPVLLVALAGAVFAGEAGLAFYHVGVERGWFEGLAACAGGATPDSLEELRAQLLGPAPPRCDEVPWALFGVSMAGYNVLYSAALAGLSLAAAATLARKARP